MHRKLFILLIDNLYIVYIVACLLTGLAAACCMISEQNKTYNAFTWRFVYPSEGNGCAVQLLQEVIIIGKYSSPARTVPHRKIFPLLRQVQERISASESLQGTHENSRGSWIPLRVLSKSVQERPRVAVSHVTTHGVLPLQMRDVQ